MLNRRSVIVGIGATSIPLPALAIQNPLIIERPSLPEVDSELVSIVHTALDNVLREHDWISIQFVNLKAPRIHPELNSVIDGVPITKARRTPFRESLVTGKHQIVIAEHAIRNLMNEIRYDSENRSKLILGRPAVPLWAEALSAVCDERTGIIFEVVQATTDTGQVVNDIWIAWGVV